MMDRSVNGSDLLKVTTPHDSFAPGTDQQTRLDHAAIDLSDTTLGNQTPVETSPANPNRHVVTATRHNEWELTPVSPTAEVTSAASLSTSPETEEMRGLREIQLTVSKALATFNDVIGNFPYVSFSFGTGKDNQSGDAFQVHISRPNGSPEAIAVDIVRDVDAGVRYSDISERALGSVAAGVVHCDPQSIGGHFTRELADNMSRTAEQCMNVLRRFRTGDVVFQNNPQGVQEFYNQPLGGYKDTGGQNKYVESFARALGMTVPDGSDHAPGQIIINRAGPSQQGILDLEKKPSAHADRAVRDGVHFFPDENVCLAFVKDQHPEQYRLKEGSHPRWQKVTAETEVAARDTVVVSGGKLKEFGIEDGKYVMIDPGPMKELAQGAKGLAEYFDAQRSASKDRNVVFANHYADAAYFGEFLQREIQTRLPSAFFLHSLGTFKAQGLDYPNLLLSERGKAKDLNDKLKIQDRILGELWVAQKCGQDLIANSDKISEHAKQYLGAKESPETMIAVDDAAQGHISREERTLHREKLEQLHKMYTASCTDPRLGDPVPEAQRLTLDQLIEAQLIVEMSRHAEPDSKGKWAVVKAMAIAQSDMRARHAEAPDRVLVINVNLDALTDKDPAFVREIETIIADIKSIRSHGGHVIVQPSFEYTYGQFLRKIGDAYISIPSFEPFGMGVLEAAAAGATVIARSDVPAVREVLSGSVSEIKVPLLNGAINLAVAEGAILVGGRPEEVKVDAQSFMKRAYRETAAAINAVTLGGQSLTPSVRFEPERLGQEATRLIQQSPYNWRSVAGRFLTKIMNSKAH